MPLKVLIVNSNEKTLRALKLELGKLDILEVDVASNGDGMLQAIAKNPPDFIVLEKGLTMSNDLTAEMQIRSSADPSIARTPIFYLAESGLFCPHCCRGECDQTGTSLLLRHFSLALERIGQSPEGDEGE